MGRKGQKRRFNVVGPKDARESLAHDGSRVCRLGPSICLLFVLANNGCSVGVLLCLLCNVAHIFGSSLLQALDRANVRRVMQAADIQVNIRVKHKWTHVRTGASTRCQIQRHFSKIPFNAYTFQDITLLKQQKKKKEKTTKKGKKKREGSITR